MSMVLLLGRPGPTEILIIVLILVLLFGAAKVPELARSFGKAKGEFQKGLKEGEKEAEAYEPEPTAEDDEEEEDAEARAS